MSLGALDFGLIVDGAVIIVENTLRASASGSINSAVRLTATSGWARSPRPRAR